MFNPTAKKRVITELPLKLYADLKIKLNYDKIKQIEFIRACFNGYLNDDPHFKQFLNNVFADKYSKHEKRIRKKDDKKLEKHENDFSTEDISEIFDILESEVSDV